FGDGAADVASLGVEEFHLRVVREEGRRGRRHVRAVASGGNGGAGEFGGDNGFRGVAEIGAGVGDRGGGAGGGESDGRRGVCRAAEFDETHAGDFVAAPLVHGVELAGAPVAVDFRHHDLIGENVPFGFR